jgi:hypothetical protein
MQTKRQPLLSDASGRKGVDQLSYYNAKVCIFISQLDEDDEAHWYNKAEENRWHEYGNVDFYI